MHPITTLVRIQSARDQLQLAANVLNACLINTATILDAGQAEKIAHSLGEIQGVEQWMMTWQETTADMVVSLGDRKRRK